MKNLNKYFLLVLAACGLVACVDDLNTQPIDRYSSTTFNQARMFSKCYATLGLTGQEGPVGDQDVEDIDEGTSAFYRTIWYMNTIPSDEGWFIWDDPGMPQFRINAWDGDNVLIKGIYGRLTMDIKYCNHFIKYADQSTEEGRNEVAEVRFIRALNYAYLLDFFYYAPLSITESTDYPHYVSRPDMYSWLVKELKDLTFELPEHRRSLYRVDQASAWLLLSRLYLNSGVYKADYTQAVPDTKPQESDLDSAIWAANKALKYDYALYTKSDSFPTIVYTAYQKLFMGDNDKNGSLLQESPLLIYQDGAYSRSYGGSFLTNAMRISGMVAWGTTAQWCCFRTSPTLVYCFTTPAGYSESAADTIKANEYQMPFRLKDDRAILCSYNLDTASNDTLAWKLVGTQQTGNNGCFMDCWAAPKFTNVYSTAPTPSASEIRYGEWPDMDMPLFRISEAYLTKAEALFRKGSVEEARNLINTTVRARAHASELKTLTEDELLAEWAREFWGEGRRRMDLVRFDRFFGPQSDVNGYNWEGRMAKDHGKSKFMKGTETYWNWFPVPSDDKKVNPNYAKDVESVSPFQGGDGYVYSK